MALYDFYGEECPHCILMAPLVDAIEKELGVKVERLEVWNNEENAKKFDELDNGKCGGVPFFYNSESGVFICGATDKETLLKWAKGEKV